MSASMSQGVETRGLVVKGAGGRVLFQDLNLSLSSDRVALVGRNGVGKSTLLRILSGETSPDAGVVKLFSNLYLVPQSIGRLELERLFTLDGVEAELERASLPTLSEVKAAEGFSFGEKRKLKLVLAKLSRADILLLDEPTEDLDEEGVEWLKGWLSQWKGGLLVATHSRELLSEFQHFFLVSESGCRLFSGDFMALESELEQEFLDEQKRYLRNLNRLQDQEERILHVARRRARKKQYGRCRELDRATPKSTLNHKRGTAQVSHGRDKRAREAKLTALREWTRSSRRALQVQLPLGLPEIELNNSPVPIIELTEVDVVLPGRTLFSNLSLSLRRQRIGVVGPNGAGKTTLLETMLGHRKPDRGRVEANYSRLASIEQGGANWKVDDSLVELLNQTSSVQSVAELLTNHKFPLALAQRPLRTLSPGERVRAALLCLFQRQPTPELLLLDEPTYSLDLVGQSALRAALKAWPGGLVVVSHDRRFLDCIGVEDYIELG